MKKLFLIFLIFAFYPLNAYSALCVENNILKCDDLGYTKSTCPYGGIACPFDISRWYCAEWTCQDGRYKDKPGINDDCLEVEYKDMTCLDCVPTICKLGSVYYADGSCGFAQNYDGSKIPVGIVFEADEEGKHGKIIALKDLTVNSTTKKFNPENPFGENSKAIKWGLYGLDIANITNYERGNIVTALKSYEPELFDGKSNTTAIIATQPTNQNCKNGTYEEGTDNYARYCFPPAAAASTEFYPHPDLKSDSVLGAGHWYLPAFGEFLNIIGYNMEAITSYFGTSGTTKTTITAINQALTTLKNQGADADTLANAYYATSSEQGPTMVWLVQSTGYRRYNSKNDSVRVRPITAF